MSARKSADCGQKPMTPTNGAIYCTGPLLRAVQVAGLYKECKYFVDMSCRYSPERILADYQLFSSCKKNESSVKHLTNFVDNHFDQPGTEMEYWNPPDWRCEPRFLQNIQDAQFRKFASDLNRIWKQLGRTMKDCVRTSPLMYSLIYLPNPLIVAGGRSLEFYYWDTYWIVRGLLYSGMIQTARGMIDNLLYLVHNYKSVPNGGRIYYWSRSHPPMLTAIVKSYVEITKDDKFAIRALPLLETEMNNFMKSHSVQVEGRTMYQYRDKSSGPRPDFYREDLASAEGFYSNQEKEEHYSHLKAACESGMNFSSRWFVSPCGNNVGTLANIKTTWIVPVDLNCLLFRNCKTLAEFNTLAGNTANAQKYRNLACGLIKAITAVLWNENRGVWFDYDLTNQIQRDFFVVTNLSPLWFHAYPIADAEKISKSVMEYIQENKLDSYPGGVPHTLNNTGEQWDYPNVWPPMMYMLIEGLNNLGTPEAKEMSMRWTERWVRSNYEAYTKTGFMFEKYNCEEFGSGGGCDCVNQAGFGWTNGVIIEMLTKYGGELKSSDDEDEGCTCAQNDVEESALVNCPITSEAYLQQISEVCECGADEPVSADNTASCVPEEKSFATSEPQPQQVAGSPCRVCELQVNTPPPCTESTQTPQSPATPPAASCGICDANAQQATPERQSNARDASCGICDANAQQAMPERQSNARAASCGVCDANTQQAPPEGQSNAESATCDRNPPQNDDTMPDICSECGGACNRQKEAAAPESCPPPKPIQIEMAPVDCLMDITPSQEEELKNMCPCDSDTETAATDVGVMDCAEMTSSSCSCIPEPKETINMIKIFPLADEFQCTSVKPVEEPETEACCCCEREQQEPIKTEKQCD